MGKVLRFPVRPDKGNENSGNEIGLLRAVRLGHVIKINFTAKVSEKTVQEQGKEILSRIFHSDEKE